MKEKTSRSWLIPLLLGIVVVVGFMIFMPSEPAAFYWTNVIYSILLIILLAIWAVVKRSMGKRHTSQFEYFVCSYLYTYITYAVVWMILCNLINHFFGLEEFMIRLYIIVILAFTALFFIFIVYSGKYDYAHHSRQSKLQSDTDKVRQLVMEIKSLAEVHKNAQTQKEWDKLIREAESIVPSKIDTCAQPLMERVQKLMNYE